jgi:hypothetical protein
VKKCRTLVLAALAVCSMASTTWASIFVEAVGAPIDGDSWGQSFSLSGNGNHFSLVGAVVFGTTFEYNPIRNISDSNWQASGTQAYASVFGPSTVSLGFQTWYNGSRGNCIDLYLDVFDGEGWVGSVHGKYDGMGDWEFTDDNCKCSKDEYVRECGIPEPATIIIWSLLGFGAMFGMRVWRRWGGPVGR